MRLKPIILCSKNNLPIQLNAVKEMFKRTTHCTDAMQLIPSVSQQPAPSERRPADHEQLTQQRIARSSGVIKKDPRACSWFFQWWDPRSSHGSVRGLEKPASSFSRCQINCSSNYNYMLSYSKCWQASVFDISSAISPQSYEPIRRG